MKRLHLLTLVLLLLLSLCVPALAEAPADTTATILFTHDAHSHFLPTVGEDGGDKSDSKYADAVRIAVEEKRISTSLLQRKLEVGYSRAAKLIDRMQSEGIVSPPDGSKPRSILITPEQYLEMFVDNVKGEGDSSPNA